MGSAQSSALAQAMNRLWAQFLPQIEERVAILEQAAQAIAEGTLTPALRDDTVAAAHKLAGTLGTFGLDDGTELAREAELLYSGDAGTLAANDRPAAIAAQLRATLARRK